MDVSVASRWTRYQARMATRKALSSQEPQEMPPTTLRLMGQWPECVHILLCSILMQKNRHLVPLHCPVLHVPNPDRDCPRSPCCSLKMLHPCKRLSCHLPIVWVPSSRYLTIELQVYFWTHYSVSLIYCLSLHKNHSVLVIIVSQ